MHRQTILKILETVLHPCHVMSRTLIQKPTQGFLKLMHHGYKNCDTLHHQLSHDRKQDVNNVENLSDSIPYSSFTNGNLRCDLWDTATLRLHAHTTSAIQLCILACASAFNFFSSCFVHAHAFDKYTSGF